MIQTIGKHTVDLDYFPGWTRKSVNFSIDDGNWEMDEKFLAIVRPAGIRGTFNLCGVWLGDHSAEEYRAFYEGNEISNHVKYHPYAFDDSATYHISDDPFDEETSDPGFLYRTDESGVYHCCGARGWRLVADSKEFLRWRVIADAEAYLRLAEEARREIRAVFGPESAGGFVWPYGRQNNAVLIAGLKAAGYYGLRKSSQDGDEKGFNLPVSRMGWNCTTAHDSLLKHAALYEAFPDDGHLKYFCAGIHSIDYERSGRWDDLRAFADRFGRRPDEYYSAPIGDVFAQEDAIRAARVTESGIENPTDKTLWLLLDGGRTTVAPRASLTF